MTIFRKFQGLDPPNIQTFKGFKDLWIEPEQYISWLILSSDITPSQRYLYQSQLYVDRYEKLYKKYFNAEKDALGNF